MPKFDINNALEQAEKEMNENGSSSNDKYWKAKEGVNRLRVLTSFVPFTSHFKKGACLGKECCPECIANRSEPDETKWNKAATKFMCQVLDYNDPIRGKDDSIVGYPIKLAQLPYKVAKALQTFQNDPDYAFDECPIPYDIKINAEGAGNTDVVYTVTPSPKREPVSPEVLAKLAKLHTPEQIKEAMQKKRRKDLGLETEVKEATSKGIEYPHEDISPDMIPF